MSLSSSCATSGTCLHFLSFAPALASLGPFADSLQGRSVVTRAYPSVLLLLPGPGVLGKQCSRAPQ